MSDTGWLVLAIVVGSLATVGWIQRERWIHRRRRRKRMDKGNPAD
ncbi:MAG TPA: hypothetical protein VFO18_14980 [Methylomirabilota bacterium]|nr:hypothetical protein [Methylomirabilota bacterium]